MASPPSGLGTQGECCSADWYLGALRQPLDYLDHAVSTDGLRLRILSQLWRAEQKPGASEADAALRSKWFRYLGTCSAGIALAKSQP